MSDCECDQCGGALESYEGESYCPDCCHVETLEPAADDAGGPSC